LQPLLMRSRFLGSFVGNLLSVSVGASCLCVTLSVILAGHLSGSLSDAVWVIEAVTSHCLGSSRAMAAFPSRVPRLPFSPFPSSDESSSLDLSKGVTLVWMASTSTGGYKY
jgi:hypothetical protein